MNNNFSKSALTALILISTNNVGNIFAMGTPYSIISSVRHGMSNETLENLANASSVDEDYLANNINIQFNTVNTAPKNTVIYSGAIEIRINPRRVEVGRCFVFTHWVYEPDDASLDVVRIVTPTGSFFDFTEGPFYSMFLG